jgi:hypothetical protein
MMILEPDLSDYSRFTGDTNCNTVQWSLSKRSHKPNDNLVSDNVKHLPLYLSRLSIEKFITFIFLWSVEVSEKSDIK